MAGARNARHRASAACLLSTTHPVPSVLPRAVILWQRQQVVAPLPLKLLPCVTSPHAMLQQTH